MVRLCFTAQKHQARQQEVLFQTNIILKVLQKIIPLLHKSKTYQPSQLAKLGPIGNFIDVEKNYYDRTTTCSF